MPKDLKVHPNERIDLLDYERGASDLTREMHAFNNEKLVLDRHSRALEGFRIELSDQATNAGQFTVYNGNAFDKDGNLLNDEDQANATNTHTLPGATSTYYVEIELASTETDVDSRAFWDPTVDNGGAPNPDGQETSLNVSTRTTYTWSLVTPVSTTGFDKTSNPNSTKIPLAILATNGSTEIDAVVNTELVTDKASTVVEFDIPAGSTSVVVIDSRLFPDTGTMEIDGESLSITANDRDNGILTFSPTTGLIHYAGERVVESSGTGADFIREQVNSNDASYDELPTSNDHAVDYLKRIFQGDERRGFALSRDKYSDTGRGDLNVRNIADLTDFLANQHLEMKFGRSRVDSGDTAPPTSFPTSPRHYDFVGGIAGARTNVVSVGDGVTSFGDFNGTNQQPILDAVAALNAAGIAGGIVFIKPGTYTLDANTTLTEDCYLMGAGDGRNSTPATIVDLATFTLTIADRTVLENITVNYTSGTGVNLPANSDLFLRNTAVFGLITATGASAGVYIYDSSVNSLDFSTNDALRVHAVGSDLGSFLTGQRAFHGGISQYGEFVNCRLFADDVTPLYVTSDIVKSSFTNCRFLVNDVSFPTITVTSGNTLADTTFTSCTFDSSIDGTTNQIATFHSSGGITNNVRFTDCLFNCSASGLSAGTPGVLVSLDGSDTVQFKGCTFSQASAQPIHAVLVEDSATSAALAVVDCLIENTYKVISLGDNATSAVISNCIFEPSFETGEEYLAVEVLTDTSEAEIIVTDNVFREGTSITSAVRVMAVFSSTVVGSVVFSNNIIDIAGSNTYGVFLQGTGNYVVNNNVFKNFSGSTVRGVTLSSEESTVTISGNVFESLDSTTSTRPIELLAGKFSVTGNTLRNNTSDTTAYGIYLDNSSTGEFTGTVTGNTICASSVTNADIYGIYALLDAATETGSISITSNSIFDLESVTSGDAAGIYVDGGSNEVTNLVVSANSIKSVVSTDNSSGIYVSDVSLLTVSNNIIDLISSTSASSGDSVRGIYVSTGTVAANVRGISVSGNSVAQINGTAGVTNRAINVVDVQGLSINNNTVGLCESASLIYVSRAVQTLKNISVNNNLLTITDAVTSEGIYFPDPLVTSENITISGNTIRNTATTGANNAPLGYDLGFIAIMDVKGLQLSSNNIFDAATTITNTIYGIYVEDGENVVASNNCIVKDLTTANGGGMRFDGINFFTINSNSFDWASGSSLGTIQILGTSDKGSVVGNTFATGQANDMFKSDTGTVTQYTFIGNAVQNTKVSHPGSGVIVVGGSRTTGVAVPDHADNYMNVDI